MKNILIVNDTTELTNWGCKGTTEAITEHLFKKDLNYKKIKFGKTSKVYRYKKNRQKNRVFRYFLIKPFKFLDYFFCSVDNISRFSKPAFLENVFEKLGRVKAVPEISSEFELVAFNWLNNNIFNDEIEKIKWADCILINGEGSIYGRETKGFYLMFLAWFVREKLNLKTPILFVNATIQIDEHRSFTLGMAKKTFNYFDELIVREPISQKKLEELDLYDGEIKCFPDMVFSHEYKLEKMKNIDFPFVLDQPFIIIGDSSHITRDEIFQKEFYKSQVLNLLKKFDKEFPDHQIVLSYCNEGLPGFDYTDYPKIKASDYSYREYIYLCSHADLHVSGRHHGSLYAIMGRCPFIMMSANTYKTEADARLVDWPFETYDLTNIAFNTDKLLKDAKKIINNKNKYSNFIDKKIKDFDRVCLNHINVLDKYI